MRNDRAKMTTLGMVDQEGLAMNNHVGCWSDKLPHPRNQEPSAEG